MTPDLIRLARVACAAIMLTFSFNACGASSGHSTSDSTTLVVGETTEPISLNPLMLEGTIAGMVGSLLYSFLVTEDGNGNLVPDAATEVPSLANGGISRDGLRLTYHLRHGIRWHDGQPLTARDCVFTFRAIMDARNNIPDRHGYDQIANVTAPDDSTLVVTLKHPYSPIVDTFLALDANYPIVPAHLLEGLPNLNTLDPARYTVGTGPFRFVEWQRGDHITLAANDSYFRGKPHVQRVVMRIIPSATTLINQLRTHEIEMAPSLQDPTVERPLHGAAGLHIVTTPASGVTMLYLNTQAGPTSDRALRRALALAVDRDGVMRHATQEAFGSEHALRGLFGTYDSAPSFPAFDPAAARAALDAAGWKMGPDGVRVKHGRRLSLTLIYMTSQSIFQIIATQLQEELHSVGADVAIRGYAPAQFISPAASGGPIFGGRFDLAVMNVFAAAGPDAGSFFICSERAPSGFNLARLCDPRIDTVFSDAIGQYDRPRVQRDVAAIERAIVDDLPVIPLGQVRWISVVSDRVANLAPTPVTPYGRVSNWTLGPMQ